MLLLCVKFLWLLLLLTNNDWTRYKCPHRLGNGLVLPALLRQGPGTACTAWATAWYCLDPIGAAASGAKAKEPSGDDEDGDEEGDEDYEVAACANFNC